MSPQEFNEHEKKISKIATKVCDSGHADGFNIENYYEDKYFVIFYKKCCELKFCINFSKSKSVKIVEEVYAKSLSDFIRYGGKTLKYNQSIGYLSVDTFVFVLDLFKKHGRYNNPNNPDIVTLFNNHKNMSTTKSARTVL